MSTFDEIGRGWDNLALWIGSHPKISLVIAVLWNIGLVYLAARIFARWC